MKTTLTALTIICSLTAFGQTSEEYLQRGIEKHNQQDFKGAIKEYDKAISEDKKNKETYYNRGTCELALKDFKFAMIDFIKTLKEAQKSLMMNTKGTRLTNSINENLVQDSLNSANSKALDSVSIDFQFRGNCYAYSSEKNAIKSKGEAHSDNLPKMVDESFTSGSFYLMIDENNLSTIDDTFLGCKLYLVNTSGAWIKLTASDSRLNIVAEALNEKNEWTPISFLPQSGCGNSYHHVILDNNEYWSFNIPIFKGTFKTKLRYTLTFANNTKISSNEIVAYLNMGQFDDKLKEVHYRNTIMDPYGE